MKKLIKVRCTDGSYYFAYRFTAMRDFLSESGKEIAKDYGVSTMSPVEFEKLDSTMYADIFTRRFG